MSSHELTLSPIKEITKKNKKTKIPELKIKIGNSEIKYTEFERKTTQKKLSVQNFNKKLYFNEEENNTSRKVKYNSEDYNISSDREMSPRKKSNLKRNSTMASQGINSEKKSVKFAGNSNEEPLETIIIIHKENTENYNNNNNDDNNNINNNNDKTNCTCNCFIF